VKASLKGDDHRVMRNAIEQLDKKTRRFAEIMMDSAVSGALQGKTMNSAGESMGEGPSAPHPFAKAEIEDSQPKDVIEKAEADPETPGESEED
jgi:molecular chaperone DnaK/molecular chaperone HscA